jgi:hypothetical protein
MGSQGIKDQLSLSRVKIKAVNHAIESQFARFPSVFNDIANRFPVYLFVQVFFASMFKRVAYSLE